MPRAWELEERELGRELRGRRRKREVR